MSATELQAALTGNTVKAGNNYALPSGWWYKQDAPVKRCAAFNPVRKHGNVSKRCRDCGRFEHEH